MEISFNLLFSLLSFDRYHVPCCICKVFTSIPACKHCDKYFCGKCETNNPCKQCRLELKIDDNSRCIGKREWCIDTTLSNAYQCPICKQWNSCRQCFDIHQGLCKTCAHIETKISNRTISPCSECKEICCSDCAFKCCDCKTLIHSKCGLYCHAEIRCNDCHRKHCRCDKHDKIKITNGDPLTCIICKKHLCEDCSYAYSCESCTDDKYGDKKKFIYCDDCDPFPDKAIDYRCDGHSLKCMFCMTKHSFVDYFYFKCEEEKCDRRFTIRSCPEHSDEEKIDSHKASHWVNGIVKCVNHAFIVCQLHGIRYRYTQLCGYCEIVKNYDIHRFPNGICNIIGQYVNGDMLSSLRTPS